MSVRSPKTSRRSAFLHLSLVTPVIEGGIEPSVADDLATMFGLLADPTRVRILQALILVDEICVVDLSLVLGISQSALSHQLALLRGHRVVSRRKEGRIVFYRLASKPVRRALTTALRDVAG